jgi:hypothetical protein
MSHANSRRRFLKGLGVGLGMLPLLQAARLFSQPGAIPKRLVIVVQTNGVISRAFFPQGNGETLSGLTLPESTNPLNPHKEDLLFLSGLELRNFTDYPGHGGGHENYSLLLTGKRGVLVDVGDPRWVPFSAGGPSVDHHIATEVTRQHNVPVPAMHLGVQVERQGGYEAQKRVSWRDVGQANSPEDDPFSVLANVFGGSSMGSPELDRLRRERRSMLDFVHGDLQRFAARLGIDDRQKVEAHLESIRQIERQLSASENVDCDGPAIDRFDVHDGRNYPRVMDAQMDLLVAALACDITRVVVLQVNNGHGDHVVFSWLGIEGGGQEFPVRHHHDVAHRPGPEERDKIRVDQWFMGRFAHLIERLRSVPEGGGSLLDHTAVLWANHMGNGGYHNSNDLPWVLAGSCGGYFRTGRHLRFPDRTPVNGVLVALCNAMGVPTETYGDAHYGGELTALRG